MKLTNEECFALTFTISNNPDLLKIALSEGDVIERKKTGVGFFSTVMLPNNSEILSNNERYWERGFNHLKLPYGGCFMIIFGNSNYLEIEAVVYESEWPEPFVEDEFSPQ